jgi:carboxypeptidase C (cathepsin A)
MSAAIAGRALLSTSAFLLSSVREVLWHQYWTTQTDVVPSPDFEVVVVATPNAESFKSQWKEAPTATNESDDTNNNGSSTDPMSPSDGLRPFQQAASTQEARSDLIVGLPGLEETESDPGFLQYSGYLDIGQGKHIFYWYVESKSNPSNDPVVLWTNGGPGCSGLIGYGVEMGPFYVSSDMKLIPRLQSWNNIANILYIEQPVGVGFSYSDSGDEHLHSDDAHAAHDNYHVILEFFKRFPERIDNPFYIASESYGGHYIPQLALYILDHDTSGKINFQGFILGNPYVDPFTNAITEMNGYYMHGLLDKPSYDHFMNRCNDRTALISDECKSMAKQMLQKFEDHGGPHQLGGINPYALDYPVCFDTTPPNKASQFPRVTEKRGNRKLRGDKAKKDSTVHAGPLTNTVSDPVIIVEPGSAQRSNDEPAPGAPKSAHHLENARPSPQGATLREHATNFNQLVTTRPPFLPVTDVYKPCSQANLQSYLNQLDVQDALHVSPTAMKAKKGELSQKWRSCGGVAYNKTQVEMSITPLYYDLLSRGARGEHNLRMMIYSGDDDSICSTAGTQAWIWSLGFHAKTVVQEEQSSPLNSNATQTHTLMNWIPWHVQNQTAGFFTLFDLGEDSNATFSFVTVHGAGHEVPAYRPVEAFVMFHNFLQGFF